MHVSCGSHSLSLIAAADYVTILKEKEYTALKQMHYQFMSKASVLWSAMKRPKSSEEIKEILSRSVVYPVETRWNSLFDAIGDLLKHRDKEKFLLNQIFKKLGKCDPFTANDYRYMQIYRNVMEPIAKTIDILQGEKDTHYGIFLPSIHSIYIKLTNLIWQTNDALEKKLGNAVLAKLDFRFKKFIDIDLSHEVVRFAVVATLSHPQLKLDWKIAKKSDPEEITELNKVMIALVKNAILKHNCHSHLNSSDQSSASDSCDKPNLKYMFIERNDNQTAAASIEKTIDTQITLYLNSPSRDDLEQFVIMKKLFKIHNTVLPSSAPVERLFNMPSIISRSRFNLNDENFENAVVLKVNRQKLSLLEL
ncbi:uncharacterized protein LOC135845050 [Planococcus citri]|uniref:uncharacterized protein LOC135845050 n=1 Tax=Planococcus citri TaxID=170843 RepID=UPI0031F7C9F2